MESQTMEMHDKPAEVSIAPQEEKPRQRFRFTKENARQMSQLAHEAKRRRIADLEARDTLNLMTEANYTQRQLARTRTHIEKLHDKITSAKEAKDLKFLSDSLAKLLEVEAKLRGPSKATSGKPSSTGFAPLD